MADSCEHGNEPSGSIRGDVFVNYLSDSLLQEGLCSVELVG